MLRGKSLPLPASVAPLAGGSVAAVVQGRRVLGRPVCARGLRGRVAGVRPGQLPHLHVDAGAAGGGAGDGDVGGRGVLGAGRARAGEGKQDGARGGARRDGPGPVKAGDPVVGGHGGCGGAVPRAVAAVAFQLGAGSLKADPAVQLHLR